MYIAEIIWFLTWPAVIVLSYVLIRFFIRKFPEKWE